MVAALRFTTALTASGFTLDRGGSSVAPDDGRGGALNMSEPERQVINL